MDIIESERVQLKIELVEDPHSPENCFIEQALGELLTREQLLFNVCYILNTNAGLFD